MAGSLLIVAYRELAKGQDCLEQKPLTRGGQISWVRKATASMPQQVTPNGVHETMSSIPTRSRSAPGAEHNADRALVYPSSDAAYPSSSMRTPSSIDPAMIHKAAKTRSNREEGS